MISGGERPQPSLSMVTCPRLVRLNNRRQPRVAAGSWPGTIIKPAPATQLLNVRHPPPFTPAPVGRLPQGRRREPLPAAGEGLPGAGNEPP